MSFFLPKRHPGQMIGAFVVAIACTAALGSMQIPQLHQLSSKPTDLSTEQVKQAVEAETLYLRLLRQLPSFGFENLVADWTFLNFLQYFGDDPARLKSDYRLSPEYFEIILRRDPRFLLAYFFLSGSTSIYAGMPERTIEIMDMGLKFVSPRNPPKSYYIWRYRGVDELLFLGDPQASQRSFEKAAEWASSYSDPESQFIAAVSQRTAQFLARNPRSKLAQFSAWTMILTSAVDERTRKRAVIEIQALGGKVFIGPDGRYQVRPPTSD
ncbi:hypothetical protein BST81_15780 [Leptolyngbya sp. 'hensonii']|uniref:hypothetical protein n=1 Tax=Leptolyngbya sp. 'hensonii' TaxID=1922337 RepID=UPI00094FFECE|nr:hypothetical protein [Leptolyngbya sp. 'hensonii']OLP17277.1 hypothetical protein BST81_15780 [Leptolyngbya sp. 'hensonii']